LHHHTNNLREEKALILRIKELDAMRASVKDLEKLEGTLGSGGKVRPTNMLMTPDPPPATQP